MGPMNGYSGVYLSSFLGLLGSLSKSEYRLFSFLINIKDEYNQIRGTQQFFADSLNIHRVHCNSDFRGLVSSGALLKLDKAYIINPYLILPKVRERKAQLEVQHYWDSLTNG